MLVYLRETLLGQLAVYVKTLRDEFNERSTLGSPREHPQGKNVPEVVNSIIWARQLDAKVSDTLSTAQALLSDLSGFKGFRRSSIEFLDELKEHQQDLYNSWSRETLAGINDPKRPLGSVHTYCATCPPTHTNTCICIHTYTRTYVPLHIHTHRQIFTVYTYVHTYIRIYSVLQPAVEAQADGVESQGRQTPGPLQ